METEANLKSSPSFAERWKKSFETTKRLPTAYLFAGPVGSGKKEVVSVIAKTLLGREAHHPDLIRLLPEKNSIRIETIRELKDRLSLKPLEGAYLMVIIEEADSLTEGAANALLKTLEEPPSYVLFILLTTVPERLPSTIRSRCQKVLFQVTSARIREGIKPLVDSWKEELLPIFQGPLSSFAAVSSLAEEVASQGDRLPSFFQVLRGYWHDLAVYRGTRNEQTLLIPEMIDLIRKRADGKEEDQIFEDMDLIGETERAIEGHVNKTLALERLFARL